MSTRLIFRTTALAAFAAALLLVIQFGIGIGIGSDLVLMGKALGVNQMTLFLRAHAPLVTALMTFDDAFAVAYSIAFVGLAYYVSARARLLGAVALVFALLTALTDLVENSLTLAATDAVTQQQPIETSWLLALYLLSQLKFLLIYVGIVLFAIGVWTERRRNRVLAILFVLFPVLGIPGIAVSSLSLLKVLWMLVLLSAGGVFLWRESQELNTASTSL